MRIFLFIFAALVAAGGTGFYLFQALGTPVQAVDTPAVAQAPKTKEVFVPAVELAAGSILRPEQLGRMAVGESLVTPEMVVADDAGAEFLTGSVARQVLPKGVPLARSAIVQPGERGFLAAVLPQGKRAIAIPIGEVAGLSGLILPGDRVDIILTYSVAGDVIDAERDIRASETMVRNLRVLALDQRLDASQTIDEKTGNLVPPPVARTATLEVTPEQAEVITLATTLGDLSLVLNSVRDGGDEVAEAGTGEAMTEPLGLTSASRLAAGLTRLNPRKLTLDSDVTSLLRREVVASTAPVAAGATPGSPVPIQDRMARVQIVRGTATRAVAIGAIDLAAEADAAPAAD
ncbi:MAG TPA: Flp pilus assembly protein CpaB [Amaricoccus sp.]|uniref:Flp pilus assembly protein CpaB n=1 Tax=Amaricoccus sp. TaxID=1872485 RepID=UPI002CF7B5D7|nr:Flp pilus assembly protein CpaB [Amaricoccus sp.]HPG21576.1 Flp pilus assembly protein CpaB [Amaricoccus sp.]HRW14750.1 Flp pilus assembly protein CpaB [Amaricoccus sp.]